MPLRKLAVTAFCLSGVLGSGLAGVGQTVGGTIRGRIVAADSGAPVRGARVTATLLDAPRTRVSVVSDAQGRFQLPPVAPGTHTIGVVKTGFIVTIYGSRYPGEPGRPIDVVESRAADIGDLPLIRAGVISGRVLDEYAEPMVQMSVAVGRPDPLTGAFNVEGVFTRTDDQGQYRLSGLRAGSYYVRVDPGPTVAIYSAEQTVLINRPGYRASYFPGRTSLGEAAPIEVRAGEEVSNIDLPMTRARLFSIAGVARDAEGRPASLATVSVTGLRAGSAEAPGGSGVVQVDGTFRRFALESGPYSITVVRQREGATEIGTTDVTIGDADVAGVVVTLGPSGTLSGRVELEPPSKSFRMTQLRAVARPSRRGIRSLRSAEQVVDDDGTFSLAGLIGPTTIGLQSAPDGWRVRTVMLGDRDLAGQDLQIAPGETVSDVRIILTSRLAELAGTVANARGEPVPDYTALVFPTDHRIWQTEGIDPRGIVRPRADGVFQVKGLLPGTYYAVALADFEPAMARDPAVLERLWPLATRVTVSADAPTHIALKLVTLP